MIQYRYSVLFAYSLTHSLTSRTYDNPNPCKIAWRSKISVTRKLRSKQVTRRIIRKVVEERNRNKTQHQKDLLPVNVSTSPRSKYPERNIHNSNIRAVIAASTALVPSTFSTYKHNRHTLLHPCAPTVAIRTDNASR